MVPPKKPTASTSKLRIPRPRRSSLPWWKGNLHAHSLWSDGDDFPEMVADWYKRKGYHFLALSDHNVMLLGQKWLELEGSRCGPQALDKCRKRFGADWVETRQHGDATTVRLKPLPEFRHLLEEPGKFLLLAAEEISEVTADTHIHVNALNLHERIRPQRGRSARAALRRDIDAVLAHSQQTGQPMLPVANHPNFAWALTAEDMLKTRGLTHFEVFNGHPAVHNYGDATHASTERLWDILLAHRLSAPDGVPLYGLAVDDSHHYHDFGRRRANPGRGWVMVRAPRLTPEAILAAVAAGDFYATTGVVLNDIQYDGTQLRLHIRPRRGFPHVTEFIGTRAGCDLAGQPLLDPDGQPLPVTQRYSDDIGHVLAEVPGNAPTYTFDGDELYVRARIISSKPKDNPFERGDVEVAWTQPFLPGRPADPAH